MEPLEKQLLMRNAERYGYQLVGPSGMQASEVLKQMVGEKDGRVLEGVPVVLTNMLMTQQPLVLKDAEGALNHALQRRFRMLVAVTYHFLFWVPGSETVRKQLYQYLKEREPSLIAVVKDKLEARAQLNIGAGVNLDVERLENTYKNYVVQQLMETQNSLTRKVEERRESYLQQALGELFTEKQRALMFKMMQHEPLTKTEREYYSRVVKPRMKALRNQDVQTLISTLLGY
jgi:hypothetical protein